MTTISRTIIENTTYYDGSHQNRHSKWFSMKNIQTPVIVNKTFYVVYCNNHHSKFVFFRKTIAL